MGCLPSGDQTEDWCEGGATITACLVIALGLLVALGDEKAAEASSVLVPAEEGWSSARACEAEADESTLMPLPAATLLLWVAGCWVAAAAWSWSVG